MLFRLIWLSFFFVCSAFAQVTFSTPGGSNININHCDDYFRTEWGTPLDMSDADHGPLSDIPAGQTRETTGYNFSNGVMTTTASGSSSQLMFLQYTPLDTVNNVPGAIPIGSRFGQAHPIDSTHYNYFVARMYSDRDTTAQLLWSISTDRYAVTAFPVYSGWHVYSIDLANANISASLGSNVQWSLGAWEGLELYPSNVSGVTIKLDYVQLVSSGCGAQALSYSAVTQGSNNRFALTVDDDLDPTNGVISRENLPTSGSASSSVFNRLLFPGSYRVYGVQSSDWATLEYGTPFDMSSSSQITPSLISSEISNPTFAAGKFSGTITGGDPSFYLNLPEGKKIPAGTYNKISIGISYTFGSGSHNSLDMWFVPAGGAIQYMGRTVTNSGSQVLNITPPGSWTGDIAAIRIDPTNDASGIGTTFSLDFISFNSSSFVGSVATPAVQPATGSLSVTDLALAMVQPDERGGRDYAQTVLGNAWLMDSAADIATVTHVLSAEILPDSSLTDPQGNAHEGDFFRAYTITGNGDPQFPNILFPLVNRIDPSTFVNVCFTGWNSTESNSFNSVARFLWHDAAGATDDPAAFKDGDDVIMRRDRHEYCLDLRTGIPVEPPLPNGSPNPWTSIASNGSSVDLARVDLSESTEAGHYSVLDSVTIRADHEANSRYAIVVDAPLTDAVDLYYNSAASTSSGTLITTLSSGRNSNVYLWDTSGLTAATYHVYGVVTRAGDTLSRLAGGRVIVDHTRDQDATAPVLECDRPSASSTFDTYLEVAGYAFDDTRLAALELFVDGTWVRRIERDKFNLAARQAYPNYADANTPGYQFSIDGTAYSLGAHTVRVVATDTAGNQTSCDRSVTRSSGNDTPLLAYPTPGNTSVAFPTPTPVSTAPPSVTPRMRATITKDTVKLSLSFLDSCTSFSIIGSAKASVANSISLGTFTRGASTSATVQAKKMLAYKAKPPRSDVNNGSLHLKVICGSRSSSIVKLDLTKIKSSKRATTEARALTKLKSLLKKV